MSIRSRLLFSALGVLMTLALGTFGYHLIEGWSLADSFYMTMITVSTVGFREVGDLHPAGRALTVVLILFGLSVGAYGLGTLTTYFVGGQIMQSLRGRRMERRIQNLRDHIIVCGYGKLGREVALELGEMDADFVVVENDEDQVERAQERGFLVVKGDATDENVLQQAGVDRAQSLIAALTGDAGNVMVTITAREVNPRLLIVARGIDDSSEAKLRRAGADRVEMPFKISGHRLTTAVRKPGFVEFLDLFSKTFAEELNMEQVIVPEDCPIAGKKILDLDIRNATGGAMIMAIERESGEMTLHPSGDVQIQPKDRLLVLGDEEQIERFKSEYKVA